jgi:flagellar motor switch protein FliM
MPEASAAEEPTGAETAVVDVLSAESIDALLSETLSDDSDADENSVEAEDPSASAKAAMPDVLSAASMTTTPPKT